MGLSVACLYYVTFQVSVLAATCIAYFYSNQERENYPVYGTSRLSSSNWYLLHACPGMLYDNVRVTIKYTIVTTLYLPIRWSHASYVPPPIIYWIAADTILHTLTQLQCAAVLEPKLYSFREMSQRILKMIFRSETRNDWYVRTSRLLLIFFLVYTLLGYLLHCNFYPWTGQ